MERLGIVPLGIRITLFGSLRSHVFDAVRNQLPDAGQRFLRRRRQPAAW